MSGVDTIARIEASVSDGGWRATGIVFNDADRLRFYQQFKVWFDLYAGSAWEPSPRFAFAGHLLPDPWQKTFQTSVANWNAVTAQELIKKGDVQGIFYKNVASSPSNRHQVIGLNYAKIVYEMISGHCNLMHSSQALIYDPQLWGIAISTVTAPEGFLFLNLDIGNSTAITDYTLKEGNFWERIQEMADKDFYIVYISQDGTFHFIPHPMFDFFLPPPVINLDSGLLLQPLKIEPRNTETVGQVIIQGASPKGVQLSGKYPSDPTIGPIVVKSGYLATSTTLMTTIATRQYKFSNRDYRIEAKIPGAIGLMLQLLDRINVTYASPADGVAWVDKKFWIDDIKVEVLDNFRAVTTLVCDAEAS